MTNNQKIAIGCVLAAAAIWWGGCEYGINSVKKTVGVDTTITVYVHDTVGIPEPGEPLPPIIKWKHDTLENDVPHTIYIDTGSYPFDLVNDYYTKRPYVDSSNPEVTIMDTVGMNRLLPGRKVTLKQKTTTIKETTVLEPPKKTVLSFDLLLSSNLTSRYGIGGGFTLKTPTDKTYGISASAITNTGLLYQFKVGYPIKLNLFKPKK